jgi:phenylalanyl-tRNA synthetase beta chain
MKISLNWLKDYVQVTATVDEICRAITFLGFEVEDVIRTGAPELSHVVVGEVLVRDKHPNADKLSVCQVDIGAGGVKTIVCGAQNYKVGDRVPVALPGAVLPGNFVIKQSAIRGQSSDGMMCSAKELGVAEDASGLLILEGRPPLGAPINSVLPAGDVVLDIEITPNRPDCQSHLGIARELAAWFKLPLLYPQENFRGTPHGAARPDLLRKVTVHAAEACPLYTAHVITGIKIGPSPAWMQQRLMAIGLRPINNVVDVGNYVMWETGQPLHAFDARKLGGNEIIVRPGMDGEKIVTLDGKERVLNSRMLVIADNEKPVVIAGIMGGENSGVSADTTDLVLECALFQRQSVRWTARKLGLSSDSSYRYERGVDPHSTLEAAWRAIDLIIETAGGQVAGPAFKIGGEVPWQREIVVTHDYICEKLGFDIPAEEMRAALELLDLTIVREEPTEKRGPAWTVSIPSWRDDLDRPIDLVEEVLRIYGTEKIPPAVVLSPGLVNDDDPVVQFNRRVTDYLVGHDFHECVNYTLRPARELTTWVSQTAAAELALANPFVEDQSHLRPTLIIGLLDVLKLNQSRGVAVSRLCEVGRIFVEHTGENLECAAVGFIIAENQGRHWLKREPADFYTTKHLVTALASASGVSLSAHQVLSPTGDYHGWQEGQAAFVGDLAQGWAARFGLLDLALVRGLGIEGKVYAGIFAILPSKLGANSVRKRYRDFSLLPAAWRDIALVVDGSTPSEEVRSHLMTIARGAAESTVAVETVDVFDVYQGAGLPEGKKSLAFTLVFRAPDRTLTDDEVNKVFNRIQNEVAQSTPYTLRK